MKHFLYKRFDACRLFNQSVYGAMPRDPASIEGVEYRGIGFDWSKVDTLTAVFDLPVSLG